MIGGGEVRATSRKQRRGEKTKGQEQEGHSQTPSYSVFKCRVLDLDYYSTTSTTRNVDGVVVLLVVGDHHGVASVVLFIM
eukprot:scaffold65336_cov58-Attheya_sp.AAC.4